MRALRVFIAANGESEKAKALLSHAYQKIASKVLSPPELQVYPKQDVETFDEARRLVLAGVEVPEGIFTARKSYDGLIISEDREVSGYMLAGLLDYAPLMKPRRIAVINCRDRSAALRVGAHNIHDLPSAEAFVRSLLE